MTRSDENGAAPSKQVKRLKFVSEKGYRDFDALYRESIRSIKDQENLRRRALRSKAKSRRETRNAQNKARGIEVMDWDELEKVTFDPRTKEHALVEAVIKLPPRSQKRIDTLARLTTEFARLYSRYRRAADRAKGANQSNYTVTDKELRYATNAAVLCIQKRVTPRQVMEYWHANIGRFSGKTPGMTIPGLAFLSSAANIDTVACSVVPDPKAPGGARVVKQEVCAKPVGGNSFSDTAGLDVRLRRGLEEAGFPTQDYNDRFLLTVQKNAIAIVEDRDMFIPKGKIRDMSRWAAENLFGDD